MSWSRRRRWLSPQNAPGARRDWSGVRRANVRCAAEDCEPRVRLSIAINSVSVEAPLFSQAATADFTSSRDAPNPSETVTIDHATGARPPGNGRDGAFVDQALRSAIGASSAGAGNAIAAGAEAGLQLHGHGARGNVVQGNTIGGPSLGNAVGLFVNHAPGNLIGGTGTAANIIEDNTGANGLTRAGGVLDAAGPSSRELSPLARSGNQAQGSIR